MGIRDQSPREDGAADGALVAVGWVGRGWRGRAGLAVGGLAVAAYIPFAFPGVFTLGVLTDSLIYVTLALSYDLSVGIVGLLSLAQPAFFGAGAYTAAIMATRFGLSLPTQIVCATLLAGALSVAIGIPALRLSHMSFGMATLGFALIVQLFAVNAMGLTNGPLCIAGLSGLSLGGLSTSVLSPAAQQYYVFLIVAAVAALGIRALTTSKIGRAMVAVREDGPMAMAMGINPKRYQLSAFVVGGAIAGLLGGFYAHYLSVVCPSNLDFAYTVNLLVIVFLGGTGGFWGIILAAFVFTAIPELLQISPENRFIIYGVVLLLAVTFMPEGFEGVFDWLTRAVRRVWRENA